mmetsp:Transcript_24050/g.29609  ORF Transcript_24050/g.29609 Transcript_24050/m.29609 type:complete len:81 (+) Transcript_24050:29-271(+)
MALYNFHQPVLVIIDGASEYWNNRANVMVSVKRRTERLRPEELVEVEPKQVLQRLDVVLQQQYARPNWIVDAMPPMIELS